MRADVLLPFSVSLYVNTAIKRPCMQPECQNHIAIRHAAITHVLCAMRNMHCLIGWFADMPVEERWMSDKSCKMMLRLANSIDSNQDDA